MMPSKLGLVLDIGIAIAIGTIVLTVGTKIVAGIRLSLLASLRTSFIAQMLTLLVAFGCGFVLADHLIIALILSSGIGLFLQAAVFQIAVRATGQTLLVGKAYLLALISILSGVFIAAPLATWIMGE